MPDTFNDKIKISIKFYINMSMVNSRNVLKIRTKINKGSISGATMITN